MKKIIVMGILTILSASLLGACKNAEAPRSGNSENMSRGQNTSQPFPETLKERPQPLAHREILLLLRM